MSGTNLITSSGNEFIYETGHYVQVNSAHLVHGTRLSICVRHVIIPEMFHGISINRLGFVAEA
jgi:hypothetical protein